MNSVIQIFLIYALPALLSAMCWVLLRFMTGSTKYAWALAIAVGYTAGHLSFVAWTTPKVEPPIVLSPTGAQELHFDVSEDPAAEDMAGTEQKADSPAGHWAKNLPAAFMSIVRPTRAVDWLPLGVLLAGFVSVNVAAFPMPGLSMGLAALISAWLAFQLVGGRVVAQGDWLTAGPGLRLLIGMATILVCWWSMQSSIVGKSRWLWMGCVSCVCVGVVAILGIRGSSTFAILGAIMLCTMAGCMSVAMFGAGTDNIRFSGAAIAAISTALLLMGWWVNQIPWYPIPLIVFSALAINVWLPEFARGTYGRLGVSFGCSLAAVALAMFV